MRIVVLGDFRYDHPRYLMNNARKFAKGFIQNGHDVFPISYRHIMEQQSRLPGKTLSRLFYKNPTDDLLCRLVRHYQPDLIWITNFKIFDGTTIGRLRDAVPDAAVACWYSDMTDGIDPSVADIAQHCQYFFSTAAGDVLDRYHLGDIVQSAFLPNPSDPDIEFPRDVSDAQRSKVLFVGKLIHGQTGQDPTRAALLEHLHRRGILTTHGCLGGATVEGIDYLRAISGSDIALSVNAFNDLPCYHSDRLTHMVGCGAFVLSAHVPESEKLFTDGQHLCYFNDIAHCDALIDQYLNDPDARQRIAASGRAFVHEQFSAARTAAFALELIDSGRCDAPWCCVRR